MANTLYLKGLFVIVSALAVMGLLGCQTTSTSTRAADREDAALIDLGNGIYEMPSSGIMWQAERSEETFNSFEEASAYVQNLELGGYTDWRLPTIYELYDLYLVFDLNKNGTCRLDLSGNYWSGEKDGDGVVGAWEIGDQCDPERLYYEKKKGYVRAVRP